MKRSVLTLLVCLLGVCGAKAVDIPAGTIHFDNSLTQYAQVQFIYGRNDQAQSFVHTMTFDGTKWSVTIPQRARNMYRYTFAATNLPEGQISQTFTSLKDSISNSLQCNRTTTTDARVRADYIYVPTSGDNWATGSWKSLQEWGGNTPVPTAPSGTLPVVYVNTTNGATIADNENYITGTCYIDNLGLPGYDTLGTAANPLPIQIRGRGNWTWSGFDKKPYKLRFDTKQAVLGMPKNKHWALMAGADDNLGFMRNTVGYMLSELIGMRWTPKQVPVELMLNGTYQGLYFLTETVRIGKNRINIAEQPNNNTNPSTLYGGWLLEIDNYEGPNQVSFHEGNGQHVRVTVDTPDSLTTLQMNYITAQVLALDSAFYEQTSTHWEQMVDLNEVAKFYLVQEIMEDSESFHGSCFFYRDSTSGAKWFFGPVWDFGNSYWRHQERFIYDRPSYAQYWIGQIASFPAFQTRVLQLWRDFLTKQRTPLMTQIEAFADHIAVAAELDADRWQNKNVNVNRDMQAARASFESNLNWRINWLCSQWGTGITAIEQASEDASVRKTFDNGQLVIIRDGVRYSVTGVRLQNER